jgi:hypothetical protein
MPDDQDKQPESESGKVTRLDRKRTSRPAPPVDTKPIDIREERARQMLGPDCPYVPLGYDETSYYVISRNQIVRQLKERDLSRNMMVSIAGEPWLEQRYPRTRKKKRGADLEVYGIAAEKAAAELMAACSVMGYWSPDDHIRGLGAWIGADGDLVLHRGDHLFLRGRVAHLGRHSEFVYVPRRPLPALPDGPRMAPLIASAASELATRLDTFRWSRGTYDADLALGWICCAIIGAALAFRPHLWITGEFGTGKTTLQTLLTALFSAAGIVSVTDASAAGLWQQMAFDSIPVGVDEIESSAELDRQAAIIKLIRQASSGALILRGGASHAGAAFTVKSCFLCSSIIIPPMPSQDASRIIALELLKDPAGVRRPPFSVDKVTMLGAALTRRLAGHYPRLVGEVLPAVRQQMQDDGFPARMADVYAALWAARDVAMHDEWSPARLAEWLARQPTVIAKETALRDLTPEWRRCLDWLLSTRTDRLRAESDTFGDLIGRGTENLLKPQRTLVQHGLFDAAGEEIAVGEDDRDGTAARNRLMRYGLQLRRLIDPATGEAAVMLIVANSHRQLAEIFAQSIWRTLPEAATGGGWSQVLRRAPGAQTTRTQWRFRAGVKSRAVILPIELVLGGDDAGDGMPAMQEPAEVVNLGRPGDMPMH